MPDNGMLRLLYQNPNRLPPICSPLSRRAGPMRLPLWYNNRRENSLAVFGRLRRPACSEKRGQSSKRWKTPFRPTPDRAIFTTMVWEETAR